MLFRKILQIIANDEKTKIDHCKELLTEKGLTTHDVEFLAEEIANSTEYLEKINWCLSKGE